MKNLLIACLAVLLLNSSQQQCKQNRMQTASSNDCLLNAVFRYNMCGVGLWGGMVLELENGEIVQPWYTDKDEIRNFQPKKDLPVRVSITEVPRDTRYADVVTCMAIGEYQDRISRYVRVDCLRPNH